MPAPKNITASIQERLRNEARSTKVAYNTLLEHFALARFFARLSQSQYADRFVLKGAQLFRIWNDNLHRPTRDADFLDYHALPPEHLAQVIDAICALTPAQIDTLKWLPSAVTPIRSETSEGGNRVKITALLGTMKIHLQIDVGYGDTVTPSPQASQWPGILDFSPVPLMTYPVETVIAEKLEAIVSLALANSRMKDFYDLYWLLSRLSPNPDNLRQAIHNTFQHRQTALPLSTPIAFTAEFFQDPQKITQWQAFLRKNALNAPSLKDVIQIIRPLLQRQP
ncbi:nucleotidyl transferase AbiEii/AbiGii toxin family protein [Coraliomargarita sp. SDUM461004]|uniref:Nucleotidyl transferase AbiEii/AbiGii toxin family protein n=1 Tax=Thalassobacterium sedimentorum TaxID=3041258 RepID=A0ABU1AH60_9BACT|nr:nucleotidyl transferase AbiEii/AbiGii toxin family protein [Coraliomargarita sp. SDUM461004]MDQ8192968.1 nucleotidyl transferase AbiEii/AbiGii toxin family protein [Coraliomargarita sp. SDUM461004]